MALQEMIVVDEKGGDNSLTAEFPYQFYAKLTSSDNETKVVTLVMPIGGKETGFYRYPKKGEKVLVIDDGGNYYLMGYLPSASVTAISNNNFLTNAKPEWVQLTEDQKNALTPDDKKKYEEDEEKQKKFNDESAILEDERGMVLRYEQTGKTDDAIKANTPSQERYSEIGFYRRPTSWKPSDAKNYQKEKNGYPKIDQINIQSTGDIHESAVNHHQMKAKRFELFVDCDPPKTAEDYESNQPFGDRNGDDSFLYAGDAHIRAKNRIVIKAGESIELQAGRSSIIINDEGITIASRKTQSNIYNSWDTVIALKASKGINMFGQHVGIRGGIDYTLSEGYGGSITSRLGVLRLAGFDVKAETINTFNYLTRGLGTGVDFLMNAGTMISGAAGAGSGMGSLGGMFSSSLVTGPLAALGSSGAVGGTDPQGTLLGLLDILLLVLMIVEIALDMAIPKVLKRDKHGRDGLYTALALVEYGLIFACFVELCTPSMACCIFEASLQLSSQAIVRIDGLTKEDSVIDAREANSPLAGVSDKNMYEAYKGGLMSAIKKITEKVKEHKTAVAIGSILGVIGVAGAAAGIGVGIGLGSYPQDKKLEEELRSL